MKIISLSKLKKESMPMIRKDQLPENYKIIKEVYGDDQVVFKITNEKNVLGKLIIVLGFDPNTFETKNIWFVSMARAEKGYGPLLYDEALRYVTDLGGYLISHEKAFQLGYDTVGKTSPEAQRVWDYYKNRPDVVHTKDGLRFK